MLCRYALVVSLVFLTGCSLAPSDKVMEQLAASERSWCVSITSVYGTVRAGGTGVQGGTMTCTQEGLSVSDTASKIGVPLIVTPTISIGQPTIK